MKNSFKLIAILLMIVFAFFLACETEEEEEEMHPLVGTWDMTNMEQAAVIKTTEQWGPYPADYALVDTTLTWAVFDYLGVWATIYFNDNETYTLIGQFPLPSDTLGGAITLSDTLPDEGTWEASENLDTLTITGIFYPIENGILTLDDPDNPTVISLYYTDSVVDSLYVPAMGMYFLIALSDSSATTLEFTKR